MHMSTCKPAFSSFQYIRIPLRIIVCRLKCVSVTEWLSRFQTFYTEFVENVPRRTVLAGSDDLWHFLFAGCSRHSLSFPHSQSSRSQPRLTTSSPTAGHPAWSSPVRAMHTSQTSPRSVSETPHRAYVFLRRCCLDMLLLLYCELGKHVHTHLVD